MARTSTIMLTRSGKSGHSWPAHDFRRIVFRFSLLRMMLAVGLYYVEVCSLYAGFLESFYHKWVLNFVKSSLCIYLDDHMVLILQFVNVVYHWFVLCILKNPCVSGINPTCSWCMILLMYCWIWLASLFFLLFLNCICFWLYWVLVAACRLSLVAVSRGSSSLWYMGFSLQWLLLLQSTGSRAHAGSELWCVGSGICGTWA